MGALYSTKGATGLGVMSLLTFQLCAPKHGSPDFPPLQKDTLSIREIHHRMCCPFQALVEMSWNVECLVGCYVEWALLVWIQGDQFPLVMQHLKACSGKKPELAFLLHGVRWASAFAAKISFTSRLANKVGPSAGDSLSLMTIKR
jgi:hypothetical protein